MIVVGLILILIVASVFIPEQKYNRDYLRLHIRANSNSEVDQRVKYEIKDLMINLLTPHLCNIESKDKAIEVVENFSPLLKSSCLETLEKRGFAYSVNIKIANEFFPTRTYVNTTLESGYYDAVIVELGESKGDNWWCVMYPPLCFVNKNENTNQIKYKSIIFDWLKKLFWFTLV